MSSTPTIKTFYPTSSSLLQVTPPPTPSPSPTPPPLILNPPLSKPKRKAPQVQPDPPMSQTAPVESGDLIGPSEVATETSRRSTRLLKLPSVTYASSSDSYPNPSAVSLEPSVGPSPALHPSNVPFELSAGAASSAASASSGAQGATTASITSGVATPATSKSGKHKPKRRGRQPIYPLRKMLNNQTCFNLSQLYKKAVYDHSQEGVEAQSRAVTAVLWHEMDRTDSTPQEKVQYHQYCGKWCPFQQWVQAGNPPNTFVRTTCKTIKGDKIPWEGTYLKGLNIEYPDAFIKVQNIFSTLGSEILMARCSKKVFSEYQ